MEHQFSKPSNTHQNSNTEPFFSTKKEESFFKPTHPQKNPNIYDAKERDRNWLGRQNDQGKFYTGNSDNARTAHENKARPNWLNGRELIYIVDYGNIPTTLGMGGYWFVDTTKGDDLRTITPKKAFLEERLNTEPELKLIKLPPNKENKEDDSPTPPPPPPICNPVNIALNFKWKSYEAEPTDKVSARAKIVEACSAWQDCNKFILITVETPELKKNALKYSSKWENVPFNVMIDRVEWVQGIIKGLPKMQNVKFLMPLIKWEIPGIGTQNTIIEFK